MRIEILSQEMASRIAAGEVVERPASVVKELVENALDARASEIFVWVEKSGSALIRVVDNGDGMAPEDLELAVERHATSKLKDNDDLFRIATLGFRGEALPSIGSVSRMAIVSRPRSAASGFCLMVEGGKKDELRPIAATFGTAVEIRDIFFNTPARRKFLKAPATELSHICDVINRTALAYPRVHFRLHHDARTVADYVAVSDPKDRMTQVLGHGAAERLTSFRWSQGELAAHGFLSSAPTSYPNPRYLFTFVNRRYVRDKVLTHAVMFGYETLLMKGQYPAVVLSLELPFGEVDVNVHPAKYEVRFRRQSEVHQVVAGAIRQALRHEAKAPGPVHFTAASAEFASVGEAALPYPASAPSMRGEPLSVGEPLSGLPPRPDETQQGFFSSLRILGQIFGCYLVCASADGLALIDQHAAHERVAFEKLRRQLEAGKVESQTLLIPETVELSAGEIMLLEENLAVMDRFGVVLEPFGPGCYEITAVPALLPAGDSGQVVRQMIAELADVDVSAKLRQRLEDRLATIACHSVVRANRALEIDEIRALLGDLDRVEFATQCPHGRPVLRQFRREELEKLFKRIA